MKIIFDVYVIIENIRKKLDTSHLSTFVMSVLDMIPYESLIKENKNRVARHPRRK